MTPVRTLVLGQDVLGLGAQEPPDGLIDHRGAERRIERPACSWRRPVSTTWSYVARSSALPSGAIAGPVSVWYPSARN